jgi:hypothetical protein
MFAGLVGCSLFLGGIRMTDIRVLVTGSRDYSDGAAMESAFLGWGRDVGFPRATLVHGGARGADSLAGRIWADRFGLPVEVHCADWAGLGKRAGHVRNQVMVDLGAAVCFAFPLSGSRGTWDCVRRARAADIPVIVVGSE